MTSPSHENSTFIIAEAGVNHNGCLDTALQLVGEAARAGADAVKFQTFRADTLVTAATEKAAYQKRTTAATESQRDMLRRLELDAEDHRELLRECTRHLTSKGRPIEFMSTPFDGQSLSLLNSLGVRRIKISSGDLTNAPLLLQAATTGLPIILSTGMSTLDEVHNALAVLAYGMVHSHPPANISACLHCYDTQEAQHALKMRVSLLHCTTQYPAPFDDVNLRCLHTLRQSFGLPTGYSDHTTGITVPVAAVALGATIIEKHFTLSRNMEGPDHNASLEPDTFAEMVRSIRIVEQSLGSGVKAPAASEQGNIPVARKSLVAACPIRKGEPFSEHNVTAKRAGEGLSPMLFWDITRCIADKDYGQDEPLSKTLLPENLQEARKTT